MSTCRYTLPLYALLVQNVEKNFIGSPVSPNIPFVNTPQHLPPSSLSRQVPKSRILKANFLNCSDSWSYTVIEVRSNPVHMRCTTRNFSWSYTSYEWDYFSLQLQCMTRNSPVPILNFSLLLK